MTSRVEQALGHENQVFVGRGVSNTWGPSLTWSYGSHNRFEEFTGNACGHALPNGDCTHRGGSERYLADGTALVGGKLVGAYVTYFDHKFSLDGAPWSPPSSACSAKAALEISGPPSATIHWSAFIKATLACGAASVTRHVRIDGRETTKITGKPVTLRLPAGEARAVGEKWVTARWALYVDPTTYLPVRMFGSNETFGGRWPRSVSSGMTDVQWLPPTAANVAKTLVTIPPGFRQVASAADQ